MIINIIFLQNSILSKILTVGKQQICPPVKESIVLAGNAAKNFLRRDLLVFTKGHYMKESNTLMGNLVNNFIRGDIWLSTKGQYMKESNAITTDATA